MTSPFETIDRHAITSKGFWEKFEGNICKEGVVFSSNLQFLCVTGKAKKRKIALANSKLFRYSKTGEKIKYFSLVCWKKLYPFTEVNLKESRFGFRLGHPNIFQDFFTDSSRDLDTWIDFLTPFVILTEPDEDFTAIKEIGKGHYGEVYLVQQNCTSEQFAMKNISKASIFSSSKHVTSLKNEVEIMRKISHPFITKLKSVYETQENVCLVLTYSNSGDLLQRILKLKKYSESSASLLIYNLLSVLSYLHSLLIVHRDLKPENILMKSQSSDTDIVLCDFGLSCFCSDTEISRCGSPGYMAPEVLNAGEFSEKVDIFAAGVILYILLTGHSPFPGRTFEEILMMNKKCDVKFKGKIWNGCSHLAVDFTSKLLNPDPLARPSANEALAHRWIYKQINLSKESTPDTGVTKSEYLESKPVNVKIGEVVMSRMSKNQGIVE